MDEYLQSTLFDDDVITYPCPIVNIAGLTDISLSKRGIIRDDIGYIRMAYPAKILNGHQVQWQALTRKIVSVSLHFPGQTAW